MGGTTPETTVLIAFINDQPNAAPPVVVFPLPKFRLTPPNFTNAQIIVAMYAVGDKTDFTTNSGPALLGWSHANGNWSNHVRKNATICDVEIPAEEGK